MDCYHQELHKGPKIIQIDQDLSMVQLSDTPNMQNHHFVNRIATTQRAVKALDDLDSHSEYLQNGGKAPRNIEN